MRLPGEEEEPLEESQDEPSAVESARPEPATENKTDDKPPAPKYDLYSLGLL